MHLDNIIRTALNKSNSNGNCTYLVQTIKILFQIAGEDKVKAAVVETDGDLISLDYISLSGEFQKLLFMYEVTHKTVALSQLRWGRGVS